GSKWEVLVHHQRQAQAESEFEDSGRAGIDEGVAYCLLENRALEQIAVVLKPDEVTQADDLHVAQAVPDAQHERVSDEDNQQQQRRRHQHVADHAFAIEPARGHTWRCLAADRARRGRAADCHVLLLRWSLQEVPLLLLQLVWSAARLARFRLLLGLALVFAARSFAHGSLRSPDVGLAYYAHACHNRQPARAASTDQVALPGASRSRQDHVAGEERC